MKKFFVILLYLISSSISFSQWTQQTIGTTNTLLDIQFVNDHVGYVSEDQGKIFKTMNNGLEWVEQNTGSNDFLNAISFIDENTGWAIGMNTGVLIYTANGGDLWTTVKTGIGTNLLDIQFVSNQIGWVVGYGGQIYKSIDGGNNWVQQPTNTSQDFWSVYFIDENVGFAAGVDVILKTIDGGANWTFSYSPGSMINTESFKSIYFTDSNNGWAVGQESGTGDGAIFHTNNGGTSWIKQNSGVTGFRLQSVHFVNNQNGWACGGNGTVLSTIDGGLNWTKENSGTTNFLRDICAIDENNIYAVGTDGSILSNSRILKLTVDWDNNKSNFEVGSINRITWNSQFVENIKIEYTTDGERSWNIIEENHPADNGFYDWLIPNTPSIYCKVRITDIANTSISDIKPNEWNDWDNDDLEGSQYYFTIYGNCKWIEIASPTNIDLTDIKFIDDLNGIAWGNGILIETIDGGYNWDTIAEFEGGKTSFVDHNFGWKLDEDTDSIYILRTENGGNEWENIVSERKIRGETSETNWFGDISFYNLNSGLLLRGYYGSASTGTIGWVYGTTDGGLSWEEIKIGDLNYSGSRLTDLHYLDENTFWFHDRFSMFGTQGNYYQYSLGQLYGNTPRTEWWNATSAWFLKDSKGGWYIETYDENNASKLNRLDVITNEWITLYFSSYRGPQYIYFYNSNMGVFYGNLFGKYPDYLPTHDLICMTQDGGESWELQKFEIAESFPKINGFFSLDGEVCWAVGDNGTILRYGNTNVSTPGIWKREIRVTDYNQSTNISFGQSTEATSSIDNDLGESELPPPPPLGTFDARFILENNSSTLLDLRNSDETEIIWTIQFQPSSSGYPIAFVWDKDNLPFGSFFLKDLITGDIVNVDMKIWDNYILTNESINKLQIVYKEQFSSAVSHHSDWDLVSVPLVADNMEVTSVFANAERNAFYFDGNYINTEILDNGLGYWIKFDYVGSTNIYGYEIDQPISVNKGWNIIGPYNQEVSIDQINTVPSGILTGNIYGFDHGYFIADKFEVGDGYWIKVTQDGEINFNGSSALGKKTESIEQNTDPAISFDITAYDGVSDSITLTFGLDSLATDGYDQFLGEQELPPAPPLGVFDIKILLKDTLIATYTDIRYLAADCYEHLVSYQLGDSSKGLTLSWDLPEGISLSIFDLLGGSVFNENFESGKGEFTISNPAINYAQLTFCYDDLIVAQHDKDLIPVEYSLSQNYPNPFNPSTKIKFGLPSESKVSLIIYNILGQEVIRLVNQQLKAGYHEVEFNNSSYSSGIYFYRIQAGDYVETKKMILLK